MAKYNVKQFTNYDIPVEKRIKDTYYLAVNNVGDIVKIGYVCGLENINKPFYISYDPTVKEWSSGDRIYPSKSGMYEFQVEELTTKTEEGDKVFDAIPRVKSIWVPADIKFKLDYVIMTQG